jgi:hypothetical protein
MKVVIIGSGNVATILGRLMIQHNINIVQVMSRNMEHAKILAEELNSNYTDLNGLVDITADLYLLAISDAALIESLLYLNIHDKPVIHTAGAVSKDVLKVLSPNYGVFYPLQSLRKEMKIIPPIPILIDASNVTTMELIREMASKISDSVQIANDETRQKIHVAAVFANNFTNHLYALAEDFCKREEIDFNLLKPLILETANKITETSPGTVQTGPAIRKDLITIEKNLNLLSEYPELKSLYIKITDSIMNLYR